MLCHSLLQLQCTSVGGEERSQLVGGDVTAVDLDQLDPGAQYEVQVMALVQNREGSPVSVRVTTRESCPLMFRHYFKVCTSFNNPHKFVDWCSSPSQTLKVTEKPLNLMCQ